jgi:hypothetical protein
VEVGRCQLVLVAAAVLALGGCSLFDAAGEGDDQPGGGGSDGGAGGDAQSACRIDDDFEDGLVAAAWVPYDDDDADWTETDGALRVSFSGTEEAWAGYDLRDGLDFNEGETWIEIAEVGGNYTGFDVYLDDAELELYVEDGNTLVGEVYGTESSDDLTEVPYVPAMHRILRIRATGGVVYWEASPDGGDWELIHMQGAPFPLDDVLVSVEAGGDSSDPPAAFESFAVSPTGCAQ